MLLSVVLSFLFYEQTRTCTPNCCCCSYFRQVVVAAASFHASCCCYCCFIWQNKCCCAAVAAAVLLCTISCCGCYCSCCYCRKISLSLHAPPLFLPQLLDLHPKSHLRNGVSGLNGCLLGVAGIAAYPRFYPGSERPSGLWGFLAVGALAR